MRWPSRILGGYRSGKTTALRELAASLPAPLLLSATKADGGCTFWDLACEIVARNDRPVRLLSTAEQRARIGDPALADAVCHYQASFLGREELRTHAHAAGAYHQWEAVADAAEDYLPPGEADWAGVLVRASLLLRDEAVLAAERARFSHVLVDDFEAASFATNRLLTQLVGYGGPVVVTGNPENAVWRFVGGSPRHLDRFARRFGAASEVVLDGSHAVVGEGERTLALAPGGDPWLPVPSGGPLPVALSTGLTWERVEVVPASPEGPDGPYDLDLLAGPDVPDDAYRAERRRHEAAARLALARSRAAQTVVQPPSTAST